MKGEEMTDEVGRMDGMGGLAEFLLARIAEREAVAKAAMPGPWEWGDESDQWSDCGPNLETVAKLPPYSDGSVGPVATVICAWGHDAWGISVEPADAEHIALNDPTFVLAECEAKRQVVERYRDAWEMAKQLARAGREEEAQAVRYGRLGLEAALEALVLPYADHADYRSEWRP